MCTCAARRYGVTSSQVADVREATAYRLPFKRRRRLMDDWAEYVAGESRDPDADPVRLRRWLMSR